jgi:pilus assembly protein CpaF
MSLRDRLEQTNISPSVGGIPLAEARIGPTHVRRGYYELRQRVHQTLLDKIDLGRLQSLESNQLNEELRLLVEVILQEEQVSLNDIERRQIVKDIRDEMLGLGPLEALLADPTISDILVNRHDSVYVERRGQLELSDVRFHDAAHLMKIIDKIVSRVGRRIDESSPMVDARLPDGSRVNAIIPPLALDGPCMSIRRFSVVPLKLQDLVNAKSLTESMAVVLRAISAGRLNVVVSGGTGSGKTTLLNIMSGFIPLHERVVTIEDAAELQLQQPHVVRLETRPPNIEGKGEVSQRALVRNALRMRPDRIILGEVRGSEAFDMLQAMNTGHEGSMGTIHANTPRDALARLENMISMSGMNLGLKPTRHQIASAVGVVVQVGRMSDGKRKVMSIQEITGLEGDMITMQEIFSFKSTGIAEGGAVEGYFSATGIRPHFAERLRILGHQLPEELFDPTRRSS